MTGLNATDWMTVLSSVGAALAAPVTYIIHVHRKFDQRIDKLDTEKADKEHVGAAIATMNSDLKYIRGRIDALYDRSTK